MYQIVRDGVPDCTLSMLYIARHSVYIIAYANPTFISGLYFSLVSKRNEKIELLLSMTNVFWSFI